MKRVLVLVEGQTEERFVKDVLAPHLSRAGVHVIPTVVVTKRVKRGPQFKGGITSFEKLRRDVLKLLGDSDAALVTTMVDLYGLPDDCPGARVRGRCVADPEITARALLSPDKASVLQQERAAFGTAEEVNDGTETHPSKRLLDRFPDYQKTLHGPEIAKQMGLERIRQECPHFDLWVRLLEAL